jgi:hypothetical protein
VTHVSGSSPLPPHSLRPLVACLAAALRIADAASANAPDHPTGTIFVTTCADHGAGSLREALSLAGDGSVIDLTGLLTCGSITLTTGALSAFAENIALVGPSQVPLTIDAGASLLHTNRAIYHSGIGTLSISNLTITDARHTGTDSRGGCIYSRGDVYLDHSVVTGCSLVPIGTTYPSQGGAIFAAGSVVTLGSTVSDSLAQASDGLSAYGGGIFAAGGVIAKYSTIEGNVAFAAGPDGRSLGGGVHGGNTVIIGSTISGNSAEIGAGVVMGGLATTGEIRNSTISGNYASRSIGGVGSVGPVTVRNSTIAFNVAVTRHCSEYGYVYCNAGLHSHGPLNIQSSIVANNYGEGDRSDISVTAGTVSGANVLTRASATLLPPGTLYADPLLYPLANNGGPTRTHALMDASPAIDAGNNEHALDVDQRGAGFARTAGANTDIGAFERQGPADGDIIFRNEFDP